MHRRRVLALLGAGTAAGLGGCLGVLGGDDSGNSGGDDSGNSGGDDSGNSGGDNSGNSGGDAPGVGVTDVAAAPTDLGGLTLEVSGVAQFTDTQPAAVEVVLRNDAEDDRYVRGIGAGRPFPSLTFEHDDGSAGLYGVTTRLRDLVPASPTDGVCWRATGSPGDFPPTGSGIGSGQSIRGTYGLVALESSESRDDECLAAGRYRAQRQLDVGPTQQDLTGHTVELSLVLER